MESLTRRTSNTPPPIRRLDPQDPTPAQEAAAQATNFVAAKRSIAAPQFSIRRMEVDKVSIHYGAKEAVKSVSLPIRQGEVLSLIGPSGCGKTTLLRSLNRLTELTAAAKLTGSIRLDDVAVVIVTHNLQQAYRIADHVAFMYLGDLVEYNSATRLFNTPAQERTREYVSGAFG